MGKSIFKGNQTFDKNNWIVTIFNSGEATSGHAALVIEGEDWMGKPYIYRCEIFACSFFSHLRNTMGANFFTLYGNKKNILDQVDRKPICYVQNEQLLGDLNHYAQYTSTSWKVLRANAMSMMSVIDKDIRDIAQKTSKAISQIGTDQVPNLDLLFTKFRKYGAQSTITSDSPGINCANWCKETLQLAGITPVDNCLESCFAAPELAAKQTISC